MSYTRNYPALGVATQINAETAAKLDANPQMKASFMAALKRNGVDSYYVAESSPAADLSAYAPKPVAPVKLPTSQPKPADTVSPAVPTQKVEVIKTADLVSADVQQSIPQTLEILNTISVATKTEAISENPQSTATQQTQAVKSDVETKSGSSKGWKIAAGIGLLLVAGGIIAATISSSSDKKEAGKKEKKTAALGCADPESVKESEPLAGPKKKRKPKTKKANRKKTYRI